MDDVTGGGDGEALDGGERVRGGRCSVVTTR